MGWDGMSLGLVLSVFFSVESVVQSSGDQAVSRSALPCYIVADTIQCPLPTWYGVTSRSRPADTSHAINATTDTVAPAESSVIVRKDAAYLAAGQTKHRDGGDGEGDAGRRMYQIYFRAGQDRIGQGWRGKTNGPRRNRQQYS